MFAQFKKKCFFALNLINTDTPDWGPIGHTKELSNNSDFGQFLD
jgi:hypothetical protein